MTTPLRHIILLCIAMLSAACTTDSSVIDDTLMSVEYSSMPIAFSTEDNVSTRGTQTTTADFSSFVVNARHYVSATGYGTDFFENQHVTKAAGSWTYSPLKYWPTAGEVDFYAYSPSTINGTFESLTMNHNAYPAWLMRYKSKDPVITSINELNSNTKPVVITSEAMAKADDAAKQQDLLLAIAPHQQRGSIDSHVALHFIHPLAGIRFQFAFAYDIPAGTTHVILAMTPLCNGGTIAIDSEGNVNWTIDESEATYYQAYAVTGTNQLADTDSKIFFLPPQTLKNFTIIARFYHKEDNDTYTLLDTRMSPHVALTLIGGRTQTLTITPSSH